MTKQTDEMLTLGGLSTISVVGRLYRDPFGDHSLLLTKAGQILWICDISTLSCLSRRKVWSASLTGIFNRKRPTRRKNVDYYSSLFVPLTSKPSSDISIQRLTFFPNYTAFSSTSKNTPTLR